MPKYLVEREIPGAGRWSAERRRKVAEKSVGVLRELGPEIQWVESYSIGGVPANRISEITAAIDPNTARG